MPKGISLYARCQYYLELYEELTVVVPATRVLLHQSPIYERVPGIKQVRLAEAVRLIWACEFGRPGQASAGHAFVLCLDSLFELS